jgi:hypothetical protein
MSQHPTTPEEAVKALLQAHGLQQPSAQFSATLVQAVVAQYVPPPVEVYPVRSWVGKAILWGLAGTLLLVLVVFASPTLLLSVAGISVGALGLGFAGLLWLLKQSVAAQQPAFSRLS